MRSDLPGAPRRGARSASAASRSSRSRHFRRAAALSALTSAALAAASSGELARSMRSSSAIQRRTSAGSISSRLPRTSPGGNSTAPYRTRIRRDTVRFTDSKRRRTSRLRPSRMVTTYQWFNPLPPSSVSVSNLAGPSSSSTPASSLASSSGVSSPTVRTAYSRSIS